MTTVIQLPLYGLISFHTAVLVLAYVDVVVLVVLVIDVFFIFIYFVFFFCSCTFVTRRSTGCMLLLGILQRRLMPPNALTECDFDFLPIHTNVHTYICTYVVSCSVPATSSCLVTAIAMCAYVCACVCKSTILRTEIVKYFLFIRLTLNILYGFALKRRDLNKEVNGLRADYIINIFNTNAKLSSVSQFSYCKYIFFFNIKIVGKVF